MLETYKTILKSAEMEFVEKGSRFIGYAFPVNTENAAIEHINELRAFHPKAHHNCFAYQIGQANQYKRQSDDGEPSGTAGMPILDVITKQDLKDTLVVVTRYFGGTLLGAGGLVRAYSRGAKEAVAAARVITNVLHQTLHISVPYTLGGKLEHEIRTRGYVLKDTLYTENIEFIIQTPMPNASLVEKHMTNITAGAAVITKGEVVYRHEAF